MANENAPRCDKCTHFYKLEEPGRAACRRFPPQTHFIVVLRQRSALQPGSVEPREEQRSSFPLVMADWYCAEFALAIALTS